MKSIKYYNQFINEDLKEDLSPKLKDEFRDLKEDLIQMIENSLKTSDFKTFDDFVDAYTKNPEETGIEGLINDSDVYEFYLKYRNDIDELYLELNFMMMFQVKWVLLVYMIMLSKELKNQLMKLSI
jgi:hypothetical protein